MRDGNRLRVLLIAPSLSILGGQAVQADRLLRRFAGDPCVQMDFQALNAPLPAALEVPVVRTILRIAIYAFQLLRRVRSYDVLHIFSAGLWSFTLWTIPALLIGKLYGRPTIVNYRDGRAEQHLERWRSAKAALLLADVIISPSDYLVDVFRKFGLQSRRIYNVIETTPFRYRLRKQIRPAFLTNRGLEPLYNVDCVLRAFALIQQKYPDATLVVANDGVCRPALESLAVQLGLRNTRFIGSVRQSEIPETYDTADVYLMSPNIDCMPGSLLECFASGIPVVATKAGGIPYIVTHEKTGLLVDLNDHEAMAACAIRLLEDPELVERLTANARAELRQYEWDVIRPQWLAVYHEMAGDTLRQAARSHA